MKANMPEKIWINPLIDLPKLNGIVDRNSVQYVRRDAFIDKTCEWLNKELPITDLSPSNMLDITFKVFDKKGKRMLIEDFKKYMED